MKRREVSDVNENENFLSLILLKFSKLTVQYFVVKWTNVESKLKFRESLVKFLFEILEKIRLHVPSQIVHNRGTRTVHDMITSNLQESCFHW